MISVIRGQGGPVIGGRGRVLASGGGWSPPPWSSSSSSSSTAWSSSSSSSSSAQSSSSSSSSSPLLHGLLAWFRNSGVDWSGNGLDLTAVGTPGTAAGINGEPGAAAFTNDASHFQRIGTIINTAPFSIQAWMRNHDPNMASFPIAQATGGTAHQGFFILGSIQSQALVNQDQVMNGPEPGDLLWHHLVLTYDGNAAVWWRDGSVFLTGSFGTPIDPGDSILMIKPFSFLGVSAQYAGMWSRVLDDTEIATLYNNGMGYDPTATSLP